MKGKYIKRRGFILCPGESSTTSTNFEDKWKQKEIKVWGVFKVFVDKENYS